MSEAEKKRRREYKAQRKKRIMIFSIVLCALILLTTVFGIIYRSLDKTLFVAYSETSNVTYQVKLFPNPYFEGEWQAANQSYVADLTDKVKADFKYALSVDEPDAEYSYLYKMTATLVVADKSTRVPIYHPIDTLVFPTGMMTKGNIDVEESVIIDYASYRAEAMEFIDAYGLTNVDAYIDVSLNVETVGNRTYSTPKTYNATLNLPLTVQTFRPETTSSVPTSEMQYLECEAGVGIVLFLVLTIVFGTLSVLGAAFLAFFVYLTRNHDINYAIKVKRLVSTYKSFIQEMTTPFATDGYQLVYIKNFNEMLEVRDTIGAPLLMYENADATATSFVIPSNMGILYCYEIRVEDYNDIYGITDEEDAFDAPAKECFVKTLWAKICDFFRNLKKKKATEVEATEDETADTEVADAEATEDEEATEAEAIEGEATEAEETPAEEISEEAPAEEIPEEAPVEEASAEEISEEAPVEEASAEE